MTNLACGLATVVLTAGQVLGQAAPSFVNVRDLGARGDGRTSDTKAVQAAIDACGGGGGGQVVVPPGVYLIGPVRMRSHVDLHLESGATLRGSPHLSDYLDGQTPPPAAKLKVPGRHEHPRRPLCLIGADNLDDISLSGTGTIDGSGGSPEFDRGDNDPFRPKIILFRNCRDVRVSDVTLRDSASWVQHYLGCVRVRISGERVYSHATLNNDGLDIDSSDVNVSDCVIDSDDDGVCLKSDRPEFCQNVTISGCVIGSNCNAIKMGTASDSGFRDVTITNCVIRAASEHRQRAWRDGISGLALEMVDGGILERIAVSNLTMTDVQTPIFIRLGARHRRTADDSASALRNVSISNIVARSDSPLCSSITGIPDAAVENVKLSHLILECPGGGTAAMARRTVPENLRGYPENRMFGPSLPASGLYVRHTRGLTIEDVRFDLAQPDQRPVIVMDDVKDVRLTNADLPGDAQMDSVLQLVGAKDIMIGGCRLTGNCPTFIAASDAERKSIVLYDNRLGSAEPIRMR